MCQLWVHLHSELSKSCLVSKALFGLVDSSDTAEIHTFMRAGEAWDVRRNGDEHQGRRKTSL